MGYNPVRIQVLSDYNASRILGSGSTTITSSTTTSTSTSSTKQTKATTNPTTTSTTSRNTNTKRSNASRNRNDEDVEESSYPKPSSLTNDNDTPIDPSLQNPLALSLGHGGLFHRVNFEDPHYNIDLPIFCIHGNHDDPSREGPTGDVLAALDMLSVANLVNYFGKSESADNIEVTPILLAKGRTRIALYGLGNIRDDRLHRVLLADKVRFRRPAMNPDDWFNIMLFHQNRENRSIRGRMGNIGIESILPSFLDLVVWGHEHECILNLETAQGRNNEGVERATRILQPGSSVETSLSDGESVRKNVVLLEVRGSQFRRTPIPLRCVRPFRIEDITLSSAGINPDAATVDEEVTNFLQGRVDAALLALQNELNQLPPSEVPPPALRLPLIRIKVEHSGFRVLSNQRFGASYVGKVANPADILLFYRKPGTTRTRASLPLSSSTIARQIVPADLHTLRVEDLVAEQLAANREAGRGLSIVPQDRLLFAMDKYIGGDTGAIRETVEDTVLVRRSETSKHNDVIRPETLVDMDRKAIHNLVNKEITAKEEANSQLKGTQTQEQLQREQERLRTQAALMSDHSDHDEDQEEEDGESTKRPTKGKGSRTTTSPARGTGRGGSRKRKASASDEEDQEETEDRSSVSEESTSGARGGRGGRGSRGGRGKATRGRGKTTATSSRSRRKQSDDEDDYEDDDEEHDEDNEEEEEYTGRSSSRSRPSAKRSRTTTSKNKSNEDPEDEVEIEEEEEEKPPPTRKSVGRTTTEPSGVTIAQTSLVGGSVFGNRQATTTTTTANNNNRDRSTSSARALPFAFNRK